MGVLEGLKKFARGDPGSGRDDPDVRSLPRWLRGEIYEDVERDIELAEAGQQAYRRVVKPDKGLVRLFGSEETGRSMKAQFRVEMDEAFTEEERMKVASHWIQKLMHGGRTRRVAEREVLRMLEELQEGV